MGLFVLAIGLGQGKQKLGSCEESDGTGKKCGSKFTRASAHPFAEYLVGKRPEIKREKKKTFLMKRKTLITLMGKDRSSDHGQ